MSKNPTTKAPLSAGFLSAANKVCNPALITTNNDKESNRAIVQALLQVSQFIQDEAIIRDWAPKEAQWDHQKETFTVTGSYGTKSIQPTPLISRTDRQANDENTVLTHSLEIRTNSQKQDEGKTKIKTEPFGRIEVRIKQNDVADESLQYTLIILADSKEGNEQRTDFTENVADGLSSGILEHVHNIHLTPKEQTRFKQTVTRLQAEAAASESKLTAEMV